MGALTEDDRQINQLAEEHHSTRKPQPADWFEWLVPARVAASIAIVWLHTPESPPLQSWYVLGRFAVPFFTASAVVLIFLSTNRRPHVSFQQSLVRRCRRLYLPFLMWSCIYYAVRAAASVVHNDTVMPPIGIHMLWEGTSLHLWFLPFVFAVTVVTDALARFVAIGKREAVLTLAALVGLIAAYSAGFMSPLVYLGKTPSHAYAALPSVLAGLLLAIAFSALDPAIWRSKILAIIAFVAFVLFVVIDCWSPNTAAANAAGVSLLLSCLGRNRPRWLSWTEPLGAVTYGVYLCHPLWVEGLQDIARFAGIHTSPQLDIAIFVTSVVSAFAFAMFCSRRRRLALLSP